MKFQEQIQGFDVGCGGWPCRPSLVHVVLRGRGGPSGERFVQPASVNNHRYPEKNTDTLKKSFLTLYLMYKILFIQFTTVVYSVSYI